MMLKKKISADDGKAVMSIRLKRKQIDYIYLHDKHAAITGSKPSLARAMEQILVDIGYKDTVKKVIRKIAKKAVKKKTKKK